VVNEDPRKVDVLGIWCGHRLNVPRTCWKRGRGGTEVGKPEDTTLLTGNKRPGRGHRRSDLSWGNNRERGRDGDPRPRSKKGGVLKRHEQLPFLKKRGGDKVGRFSRGNIAWRRFKLRNRRNLKRKKGHNRSEQPDQSLNWERSRTRRWAWVTPLRGRTHATWLK